jgi:hypothetical protein
MVGARRGGASIRCDHPRLLSSIEVVRRALAGWANSCRHYQSFIAIMKMQQPLSFNDIPAKRKLVTKSAVPATSGEKQEKEDTFDAGSSHRESAREQDDDSDLKTCASHPPASFLSAFKRNQTNRCRHMPRSNIRCGVGRATHQHSAMRSPAVLQSCRRWLIFPALLLAVQLLQPCGAKASDHEEKTRPAHKLWSSALSTELRSKYAYPWPFPEVVLGATLREVCPSCIIYDSIFCSFSHKKTEMSK